MRIVGRLCQTPGINRRFTETPYNYPPATTRTQFRALILCSASELDGFKPSSLATRIRKSTVWPAGRNTVKTQQEIYLAARNHAHEFDAIAFDEFSLGPLTLVQRCRVVLYKHCVWLKAIMRGKFSHIADAIHLGDLAVDPHFHDGTSPASQSFQTGSNPRRRRTAATSAGERSSLISN